MGAVDHNDGGSTPWLDKLVTAKDAGEEQRRPPSAPAATRVTSAERSDVAADAWEHDRQENYARAALKAELDAVRSAATGNRNNTLNKAAYSIGQLIAGGVLAGREAVEDLRAAATASGLGEKEIKKTLASALEKGMKNPRGVPEPTKRASVKGDRRDPPRPRLASSTSIDSAWRNRLLMNKSNEPKRAMANVETALRHHPLWQGRLRKNAFTGAVELVGNVPWKRPRDATPEWSEQDDSQLIIWLEREIGPSFPAGHVRAAVNLVAADREHHPIRQWLASLEWDGVGRLGTWLTSYLGAKDQPDDYLAKVGTWSLIGAVARVERPGCQVDHMPVWEGPQGLGKSSFARELFGDGYFGTISTAMGDKDSFMVLRSKWGMEVEELAGMRRTDIERVKSYISARTDTYRPPYGRAAISVPRQNVFIGTTNSDAWMPDATGGRRFWPVRCGTIELEALRRDRDQLWAEAYQRFMNGEPWWPGDDDRIELAEQVDERAMVDPWEQKIADWLVPKSDVTMGDILGDCLGKDPGDWTRADETRVGGVMARLRWRRHRRRGVGPNGERGYVYEREEGAS